MILKINTGCGWTLFDGFNELNYTRHDAGDIIGVREDCHDYCGRQNALAGEATAVIQGRRDFTEIWLTYGDDRRQILTDNPAYVLNDNGKTVETI